MVMSDTNVIYLSCDTVLDIPAERVLSSAIESDLDEAIIVGVDKLGELYFAGTMAEPAKIVWLLECAKQIVLTKQLAHSL